MRLFEQKYTFFFFEQKYPFFEQKYMSTKVIISYENATSHPDLRKIKMMRYKSAFSVSKRCVAYQLATKGQNITAECEQLERDFSANPDEKRKF